MPAVFMQKSSIEKMVPKESAKQFSLSRLEFEFDVFTTQEMESRVVLPSECPLTYGLAASPASTALQRLYSLSSLMGSVCTLHSGLFFLLPLQLGGWKLWSPLTPWHCGLNLLLPWQLGALLPWLAGTYPNGPVRKHKS